MKVVPSSDDLQDEAFIVARMAKLMAGFSVLPTGVVCYRESTIKQCTWNLLCFFQMDVMVLESRNGKVKEGRK